MIPLSALIWLPLDAEFAHRMQLRSSAGDTLQTPPPLYLAELAVKVQLANVVDEDELHMPPPLCKDEFPVNAQLVNVVGEEDPLYMPPPLFEAELPVNLQLANRRGR